MLSFCTLLDPGVFTVNVKRTGISSAEMGFLQNTFSLVHRLNRNLLRRRPRPPAGPVGLLVNVELTADTAGKGFTEHP